MSTKKSSLVLFQLFGLFLLMISLVSCTAKAFTYKGSWVAKDDRIFLQDAEPHKGIWQTRDVNIEYACQQEAQNLQISGMVKLGDYLTTGFNKMDGFTLNIYTLNAEGMVLDSASIIFSGYQRNLDTLGAMTFAKRLVLPDNTAAITFGYSGRVTEGGHGGLDQIDWSFWKSPGSKP